MIRMLLQAAINIVTAAVGLLLAGALIDGVALQPTGFIAAVVVFVVAQAIMGPFVFNIARKHAAAILGGVGLVSTLLALWIASLLPDGLTISGAMAWAFATLLVWIVTALGTWILGYFVLKRWWDRRAETKSVRRAMA